MSAAINQLLPSVEAFNIAIRETGWDARMLQIDMKSKPVQLRACESSRVGLMEVQFPNRVHQQASTPRDRLTFGIPTRPQQDLLRGGISITSETISFFEDCLETVSEPGFSAYTISIDRQMMNRSLKRLVPDYSDSAVTFRSETRRLDEHRIQSTRLGLRQMIQSACDTRLKQSTRAKLIGNFEAQLPTMLVDLWTTSEPEVAKPGAGLRRAAVRRALELLATDDWRYCSLEDLCEAAACSQRTLERAFRERFSITPKQYLVRLRLAAVHRTLLDKGDADERDQDQEENHPIGDLAAAYGFWHLSQFAASYRSMYGETPSATLRRARLSARQNPTDKNRTGP